MPQTIAQVRRDDKFEGLLLVRSSEQKRNASGKYYLVLNLADCSGSVTAMVWDGTIQPPPAGSVIQVNATGNEFNGRMQLRVNTFRVVPQEDLSPEDMARLIPCAPWPPEKMRAAVQRAAEEIADPDLRKITCRLLERAGERLLTFPAAKQMHHAERSGLLHHTLTMLRAARGLLPVYPQLNASLLIAGVIVHDLSKLDEMDADGYGSVTDYTLDGKLLGHLVRGVVSIQEAARETGADPKKALLLQHMEISHHGMKEYGSPLEPMFPEAEVLSQLDRLDARLFQMQEAIGRTSPGAFSEKVYGLDNRQIYRIPEDQLL